MIRFGKETFGKKKVRVLYTMTEIKSVKISTYMEVNYSYKRNKTKLKSKRGEDEFYSITGGRGTDFQ